MTTEITYSTSFTLADVSTIEAEPRVYDLVLAERLGFERPRKIREIIARNKAELESFGLLPHRVAEKVSPHGTAKLDAAQGGRPSAGYWLNEPQALLLCMFSQTDKAAEVRRQLIEVFMAWRLGRTVPVRSHHRRPPVKLPAYEFGLSQAGSGGLMTVRAVVPAAMALKFMQMYTELA